jgi:hypothetical protein
MLMLVFGVLDECGKPAGSSLEPPLAVAAMHNQQTPKCLQ